MTKTVLIEQLTRIRQKYKEKCKKFKARKAYLISFDSLDDQVLKEAIEVVKEKEHTMSIIDELRKIAELIDISVYNLSSRQADIYQGRINEAYSRIYNIIDCNTNNTYKNNKIVNKQNRDNKEQAIKYLNQNIDLLTTYINNIKVEKARTANNKKVEIFRKALQEKEDELNTLIYLKSLLG